MFCLLFGVFGLWLFMCSLGDFGLFEVCCHVYCCLLFIDLHLYRFYIITLIDILGGLGNSSFGVVFSGFSGFGFRVFRGVEFGGFSGFGIWVFSHFRGCFVTDRG